MNGVFDVSLRSEVKFVGNLEFQRPDWNSLAGDTGFDGVFEGGGIELVAGKLEFQMRRDLIRRRNPDVVAVFEHLVHRIERHCGPPESLLGEGVSEFVGGLLVDRLDEDVDILGGTGSAGKDRNVPRDVDVLEVESVENGRETDREVIEPVRLPPNDERVVPQLDTAHIYR